MKNGNKMKLYENVVVDVETPAEKRPERKKSKEKKNLLCNNPKEAVRQLYELVTGEEIDTKDKGNN